MTGIIQGLLASIGSAVASAASDAYFNLVTLLLNTSSTNGAQNNTFLDSSTNNFTVTRNGNTTQGTFTPFSQTGWGNYFNGSSYLQNSTSAPLATTASTFTIEAWVYMTAAPTNGTSNRVSVIADANPTGSTMYWGFGVNSSQQISFFWYASGDNSVTGNTTISLNAWHHIAMSVSSNAISMYVDGVQQTLSGTTTLTNRSGTTFGDVGIAFELGYWNASAVFYGYMSNVRIVSGTAVYSGSSFTPPTTPLTAISGTSVLTCQSNRFVDNSTNAYPFTIGGTPSVQAFSPFLPTAEYDTAVVGGSGYFDGSGDYLTTPSSSSFNLSSGDWTIEGWFWLNANSGDTRLFTVVNSSTDMYGAIVRSGTIRFGQLGVGEAAFGTINLNSWNHIAFSKNSTSTITCYINGISTGTTTSYTLPNANCTVYIAASPANYALSDTNGYVSNFRIVKGTAVYTSAFTPPTAPLTAITNTSLLLSGTNAGIYDSASKNVLETVGNAQVSTTQAKWGTTSMYFDGTGDYLAIPSGYNLGFGTGDFTIEGWLYLNATSSYSTIMSNRPNGSDTTTGRWSVAVRSSAFEFYANGGQIVSAGTVSTSTWTHFAVTRASGSIRLFLGGTQVGSTTSFTTDLSSLATWVGANGAGTEQIDAYMDDLRITKGYARYTANFTPPTAAFPLQ